MRRAVPRRRAVAVILALAASAGLPVGAAAAAGAGATGSISGTVVAGEAPTCVLVLDSTGQAVASAATASSGAYTVDGVPAGTWTVEFVPDDGCLGTNTDAGYAFEYYSDAGTPASATSVAVTAGETTTGIDASLPVAAMITGNVTGTDGSELSDVCVILEDLSGSPVLRQPTDPQGDYVLSDLPPGQFLIEFVDDGCIGNIPQYQSAWYAGGSSVQSATPITVSPGMLVSHVDATLEPAASPQTAGAGGDSGSVTTSGSDAGGTTGAGTASTSSLDTTSTPSITSRAATATIGLSAIGRHWTVDRRHQLRLRLLCNAGGATCHAALSVFTVVGLGRRSRRGRLVGTQSVTVNSGQVKTVLIRLYGVSRGRLWISAALRGQRSPLHLIVPAYWAPTPSPGLDRGVSHLRR